MGALFDPPKPQGPDPALVKAQQDQVSGTE